VNISNGGSNLTDYQVNITLNTQALITAGKMRSDCGDLRLIASNDSAQLPYWIEAGCNNTTTRIWVKVPSIPTAGTVIYMYYGNPSAANASNYTAVFLSATGGTITYSGNYTIHTFTSNGTFNTSFSGNVKVLVVAGGGGGGQAGGGAGGLVYSNNFSVSSQSYAVTVGNGGSPNNKGQNSSFSTLNAEGGGIGADGGTISTNGGDGGSGGGAATDNLHSSGTGGTATSGQGYNGGSVSGTRSGGGGGGAGQAGGGGGSTGWRGGNGLSYDITGTPTYYAGGGGGGSLYVGGAAGLGGGGSGGSGIPDIQATNGTVNTGGGAGGNWGAFKYGGSGIVIIRYINRLIASPEPVPNIGQEQQPDTTAPSVQVQSPTSQAYNTSIVNVNFTATDNTAVSSCTIRLNGTVNSSACSNYTLNLANGAYNLTVTANDTSGNMNSSQVLFTVATDTTPPSISIQSPANTTYTTGTIQVNFIATDNTAVSSCTIRLNGTINSSACSNYTLTLSNGNYTLNVTANDTSGNLNSAQVSFTVSISTQAQSSSSPQISTVSGIADGNVTFSFTPAALRLKVGTQEFPQKTLKASAGVNKVQIRTRVTSAGQTAPDGTKATYTISE